MTLLSQGCCNCKIIRKSPFIHALLRLFLYLHRILTNFMSIICYFAFIFRNFNNYLLKSPSLILYSKLWVIFFFFLFFLNAQLKYVNCLTKLDSIKIYRGSNFHTNNLSFQVFVLPLFLFAFKLFVILIMKALVADAV